MSERLEAMRRLARVQGQVKRLAEADLRSAENHQRDIAATALGLDTFMGDPDLSSRMISMAIGQRRKVAVRLGEAERALAAQTEATREARSRARLAERMVDSLGVEETRAEERKDLERLIEAMANRGRTPDASLP